MDILLSPPVAFLIYIPLVAIIAWVGSAMAGRKHQTTPNKTSWFSSGEKAQTSIAAPGYRPFFLIAFFFAILHLGMLVLGSGSLTTVAPFYLIGLLLALLTLILG